MQRVKHFITAFILCITYEKDHSFINFPYIMEDEGQYDIIRLYSDSNKALGNEIRKRVRSSD